MCALLWTKFLLSTNRNSYIVNNIHQLCSAVIMISATKQDMLNCLIVCLTCTYQSMTDTPVLKASAFNIVSCSRIRQYASATPASRFLGQRILVLTSGINSYVCLPLLSQSHLRCHDVWLHHIYKRNFLHEVCSWVCGWGRLLHYQPKSNVGWLNCTQHIPATINWSFIGLKEVFLWGMHRKRG